MRRILGGLYMITLYYNLVNTIVYWLTGISNKGMTMKEFITYSRVSEMVETSLIIIAGCIMVIISLAIALHRDIKKEAVNTNN
jgi:sulfite exporter TauE/SafE